MHTTNCPYTAISIHPLFIHTLYLYILKITPFITSLNTMINVSDLLFKALQLTTKSVLGGQKRTIYISSVSSQPAVIGGPTKWLKITYTVRVTFYYAAPALLILTGIR